MDTSPSDAQMRVGQSLGSQHSSGAHAIEEALDPRREVRMHGIGHPLRLAHIQQAAWSVAVPRYAS